MPNANVPPAVALPGSLVRPDWRAGTELTAVDLRLEQNYELQRTRRHLRLAHGWGVLCGLNVVPVGLSPNWDLLICPGYGLGPCGDEILLPRSIRFNLQDYLWTQPVAFYGNRAWIAIEATADPAAYAPEAATECGCGCADSAERVSRFTDGVRVVVLWTSPLQFLNSFDICNGGAPACPACPPICALPLASVQLPSLNEPILMSDIQLMGGA